MKENPLYDLKDTLENLKSVLVLITDEKMKNLESLQNDLLKFKTTAEQMELEKTLLNNIDKLNQDSKKIEELTISTAKKFDKALRTYL